MGEIVKSLVGGGDNGAAEAREAAEKSRKEQAVANDRQLNEANRQEQKTSVRRRAPRGRKLFEDGPDGASTKLGD